MNLWLKYIDCALYPYSMLIRGNIYFAGVTNFKFHTLFQLYL